MLTDSIAGELRMKYVERQRQKRFEESKKELHQVFLLRRLFLAREICAEKVGRAKVATAHNGSPVTERAALQCCVQR